MAKNEAFQGQSRDVEKYLSGLEFPATKQGILNHAKQRNAPQEMVAALNGLPDKEYMDMEELTKEMESR